MLWDYFALEEARKMDGLVRDAESIEHAGRIGMATLKPEMLRDERLRLSARIRRFSSGRTPAEEARLERARAEQLVARIQRSGAMDDVTGAAGAAGAAGGDAGGAA